MIRHRYKAFSNVGDSASTNKILKRVDSTLLAISWGKHSLTASLDVLQTIRSLRDENCWELLTYGDIALLVSAVYSQRFTAKGARGPAAEEGEEPPLVRWAESAVFSVSDLTHLYSRCTGHIEEETLRQNVRPVLLASVGSVFTQLVQDVKLMYLGLGIGGIGSNGKMTAKESNKASKALLKRFGCSGADCDEEGQFAEQIMSLLLRLCVRAMSLLDNLLVLKKEQGGDDSLVWTGDGEDGGDDQDEEVWADEDEGEGEGDKAWEGEWDWGRVSSVCGELQLVLGDPSVLVREAVFEGDVVQVRVLCAICYMLHVCAIQLSSISNLYCCRYVH